MKAGERHKLKTNELAESLEHLPEYLRTHGTRIVIVIVVVLVVGVGGMWWSKSAQAAKLQQFERLHELLITIDREQAMTAFQSRQATAAGRDATQAFPPSYASSVLVRSLAELAAQAQGTPVAVTAILQQAEVMRSELLYAGRVISAAQKEEICTAARALYEQVIELHSSSAVATGAARMGLGLVAEELGQWDAARQIYQKLVAETGTPVAATAFPSAAQQRLSALDSFAEPLVFAPAPMLPLNEMLPEMNLGNVPLADLTPAPQE